MSEHIIREIVPKRFSHSQRSENYFFSRAKNPLPLIRIALIRALLGIARRIVGNIGGVKVKETCVGFASRKFVHAVVGLT